MDIKTIRVKNEHYIRTKDIIEYIEEFASTEETDTKNRLLESCHNLKKLVVPKGLYCYDKNGNCPYWSIDRNREHRDNGYCSLLERGDWEVSSLSLLWDKCKECRINI